MENEQETIQETVAAEVELVRRRDFLKGMKKWSQAVIGGIILAGMLPAPEVKAGWVNRRGSWINGGSGGWANRGVSWINGGGGWLNGRGGGGSWVNRRGW